MNQLTPSTPQPLSAKLGALLASSETPILPPTAANELRCWLDRQTDPVELSRDDVDEHITALSFATKERASTKKEADARLDLYWRALRGQAKVDLARATDDLIKSMTFMPTPAEVLKATAQYANKRAFARFRARHLLRLHEEKYRPPLRAEDRPDPEDVKRLIANISAEFPSARTDCVGVANGGSST